MFDKFKNSILEKISMSIPDSLAITAAAKFNAQLQKKAIELQSNLQHNGVVAFILLPNTNPNLPTDTQLNAVEVYEDPKSNNFIFGDNLLGDDISITDFAKTIDINKILNSFPQENINIKNFFKEETPPHKVEPIKDDYEQRIVEEEATSRQQVNYSYSTQSDTQNSSEIEEETTQNPIPHE